MLVRFVLCAALIGLTACSATHETERIKTPSSSPTPSSSSSIDSRSTAQSAATSTSAAVSRSTAQSSETSTQELPLSLPTGSATQVITAVGPSLGSTRGTLQAWQKVAGGWTRVGTSTPAWFGSAGLTTHMSEQISGTPVGSFTLTQAFGSQPNPGAALPYFRTDSADWWISKTTAPDAALYNTHQHCAGSCPFTQGAPNEHLVTAQPFYRYALVVDYNTRNAPGGVRVGAGSAVFLHVTVDAPTEGCISIDESRLVALMRWLTPGSHPRILIGVH